jgi:hypothetical protein
MQSDNTYDETEIRKMIREMIFCFTTGDEPIDLENIDLLVD